MMINKRLIQLVSSSKKYIGGNILCQWISLLANILMIFVLGNLLMSYWNKTNNPQLLAASACIIAVCILIRFLFTFLQSKMSYGSSKNVKSALRTRIFKKLLRLGPSYHNRISTSEVVQVASEGVEQLEVYFGKYLPQFFYSLLAPLTLFIVLSFVSFKAALILLLCVPLIPLSIAAVQTLAKKLLSKYWGVYTDLGDSFLENLQGLTTLKIYQADEFKQKEMNEQAERFRKITMKVLTMQLNSVTLMDLIAFGGAAAGVILSLLEWKAGRINFTGCFAIILLSADFFLPLRMLGSFFHIAMNGMAASDKIFKLIDLPEGEKKERELVEKIDSIQFENTGFSYEADREILRSLSFSIPSQGLTAIVGESGCGKSTIAALMTGRSQGYTGSIRINGVELSTVKEACLMKKVTLVSSNSFLFQGTVRENLLMGNPDASDKMLWDALRQANLTDFLESEQGLDTAISERASNLSGGQCQRLCLARALLHNSDVYIFDEATSNVDVESENDIMAAIHRLAQSKMVLVISHRLANVEQANQILVLKDGALAESGSHSQCMAHAGGYRQMWNQQKDLERIRETPPLQNHRKAGF